MHKNFLYFLLKHKVSATCVQRWGIFCFLTRYGSTLFVPLQKKTFLGHFLKALALYVPRLYVGQKVHFPCIMYLMQPHYLPSLGSVKKGFGKEGSRPQEVNFQLLFTTYFPIQWEYFRLWRKRLNGGLFQDFRLAILCNVCKSLLHKSCLKYSLELCRQNA